MNRGWVQHQGIEIPWRNLFFQKAWLGWLWSGGILRLQKIVPIGSRTTVLAVVRFLSDEVGLLEILDGALDCGSGERQFSGDGVQPRPGDVVLVLPVVEIQIDQLGAVRQVHAIQKVQPSHWSPPTEVLAAHSS